MKKIFVLFITLIALCQLKSHAQFSRYVIQLKYKAPTQNTLNNPSAFLTQRALDRRLRYHIIIDSTDMPVSAAYIDSIRLSGNVTIISASKWFNQVCIQTSDAAALNKINSFSFVNTASLVGARPTGKVAPANKIFEPVTGKKANKPSATLGVNDYYSYGQAYNQIHIHNGEFLHNYGFKGEGMVLAMLDAGFTNYLTIPTFDSIRKNGQILGTWDFVSNNDNVNEDYPHGTSCLSTIAANMPGVFVGTAPKTSFYLYRSEDAYTEYPVEEHNWSVAAERADSLGSDLISTSLGYTTFTNPVFDYTYSDMDGNTTLIARAADIASKKGIMVVVANGNEGDKAWHYLATPADADSVLAVGAINVANQPAAFSSYGPSSDGQIKPDVVAVGANAIVADATSGQPSYNNGTSFACPIIAGLSTCLWQAFPEVNNMSIIDVMRKSADRYTTPDNKVGYGTPDMKDAFVLLIKQLATQSAKLTDCKTTVSWTAKSSTGMNFIIQRKLPSDADYVTLTTQNTNGTFMSRYFSYTDDLAGLPTPSNISYRIKMLIGTDTSFYFDALPSVNYIYPCNTYTFIGNGNWDVPGNWSNQLIPPASLPDGSTIIIDPVTNGECILNIQQYITSGAHFIINPGKKLLVPENLVIQ